jgi:RNA-binding protein YlmH
LLEIAQAFWLVAISESQSEVTLLEIAQTFWFVAISESQSDVTLLEIALTRPAPLTRRAGTMGAGP